MENEVQKSKDKQSAARKKQSKNKQKLNSIEAAAVQ